MSTVGKVLSVLIVLVAIVWVLLTATVAQLNRNGTKAVETLQAQVAKLEQDVVQSARALDGLKEQTHVVQVRTQNELTTLQARIADVEKARSAWLETSSRVKLQLADAEALVEKGNAESKQRQTEKEAETKALQDAVESVRKLASENDDLLARLDSLRDKFRSTLSENRGLVERLRKSNQRPTTRPASLTR